MLTQAARSYALLVCAIDGYHGAWVSTQMINFWRSTDRPGLCCSETVYKKQAKKCHASPLQVVDQLVSWLAS